MQQSSGQQSTPNPAGTPSPSRGGVQTFRILTVTAAGMATLLALLPAVGHDQLWCLYVGQRMLHGVQLYGPQLLESNPPLIMWFSELLAAVSGAISLPITALFKAAILILCAASAAFSFRLLRRLQPSLGPVTAWTLAFAFVTIFGVMPARDFGQRDHLLAVLCLPYLVAAALRASRSAQENHIPVSLALLIGAGAGVGLCLKPHHALVPLAVEAVLLMKRRSARALLRPELGAMIVAGLASVAAIRFLTPAYLTSIVPLLREVYWAIGHLSFAGLVWEAIQLHVLILLTLGLVFFLGWRTASTLATILIAAGLACTAAYYLQGTGWYYQQLPAISFFSFALVLLLIELARRRPFALPRSLPWAAAGLGTLAVVLTTHFMGYPFTADRSFPIDLPDASFFVDLAPGTPVAILTTAVDDAVPPVAKYHLLWAQRTNNLWVLPAILRNESPANGQPPLHVIPPERLAELGREQHRWMVEDLERWRPVLVLVERCQAPEVHCQVLEDRHDDLLAWFSRDPAFRAVFEKYHFLRSAGPYDAYGPQ